MRKKPHNICFVTEDFYPSFIGGQGVYGKELVAGLAQKWIAVTVIAEKRNKRREFWERVARVRVLLVPFCFGNQLLLAIFQYVYFIVCYHSEQFDILHANQLTGLLFVLFRPKNVGKIVVTVHNTWEQMVVCSRLRIKKMLYNPLIWLEAIVFRRADGLVFHTRSEKRYVTAKYTIRTPSVVVPLGAPCVPQSVRDTRLVRRVVRKEVGVPENSAIVLFIGRLTPRKNVATMLRALHILQRQAKEFYGLVIGEGADRSRLEDLAPANVRFLGFVPDTRSYLLAADMFVLPSVAEGGVALSVLEAAAYGLPLLVSSEASDETILVHGKNGYVIDPYDAEALAGQMVRVFRNRSRFGRKSRRKARRLTWDRCVKETVRFYESLLGKFSGRQ